MDLEGDAWAEDGVETCGAVAAEVGCGGIDGDNGVQVDDGEAEEDDGEEEDGDATEEALRMQETCRVLERNPRTPPPLIVAARQQRERAEVRWRAAKRPHPLHKRLRWAQQAYDAAAAKQLANQREFDRFEEDAATRRRFFLERAEVDSARTSRKLRALEELVGQGGQHPVPAAERAARVAATGIADDLGPALAAVAERVPEGSQEWLDLQAALATLANVEDVLRAGLAPPPRQPSAGAARPTQYDISDDHDVDGEARGGAGGSTTTTSTGGAATSATAPGRHDGTTARLARGAENPEEAQAAPTRWRGPRPGDTRWGGQAWQKQGGGNGGTSDGTERCITTSAQAVEDARAQAAEALRLQQQHAEQQQRVVAEAAAAAEAVRRAQRAVAEAEAVETARLEREKADIVARTSPEELRRAQQLYAQQSAIAAAGFGTPQAAAAAEMLQAAAPAGASAGGGGDEDGTDLLMRMSPEELADMQRGTMDAGQCPW